MARRDYIYDALVTIYTWNGSAWNSAQKVLSATPSSCIDGMAERVSFEHSVEEVDMTGGSDRRTQVLPGPGKTTVTIDKFVSADLTFKDVTGIKIGQPLKIVLQAVEGTSATETYMLMITSVKWSTGKAEKQIESLTAAGDYHGATA
jgi:hypothetical protein